MSTNDSPSSSHDEHQRAASPTTSQQDPDTSLSSINSSQPSVDNGDNDTSRAAGKAEKHPRARRKRTTAEDKRILEDFYQVNPKPDKQARLELVSRVSLTEKEVQIWFQNRRQNDRRRSRPLSVQDMEAMRWCGIRPVAGDHSNQSVLKVTQPPCPVSEPAHDASSPSQHPQSTYGAGTPVVFQGHSRSLSESTTPYRYQEQHSSQESQSSPYPSSAPSSAPPQVGYLSNRNRWRHNNSFASATTSRHTDGSFRPDSSFSSGTENNGRSPGSIWHLSCSLDGKAELIPREDSATTPTSASMAQRRSASPSHTPEIVQPKPPTLQRSSSTSSRVSLPPISALTGDLPPRVAGRSRNVQAWESCASSETRDELTTMAENESSGSAAAHISMLRSSSGALMPSNSAKRNVNTANSQLKQGQAKRAKLGRASSSIARLGGDVGGSKPQKPVELGDGRLKPVSAPSPTDSEKENWSPDEDGNPRRHPRRRPLPSAAPAGEMPVPRRRVLQESRRGVPSPLGSRSSTAPIGRRRRKDRDIAIFEDSGSGAPARGADQEVEKFMRGDVSPGKKGDMDCVQGLLSLAKGEWK